MYERFTERARQIMHFAGRYAKHREQKYVESDDVLFAMILEGNGVAAHVLKSFGVDSHLFGAASQLPPDEAKNLAHQFRKTLSREVKQLLECSIKESILLGHDYVGTEHLLLGLCLTKPSRATSLLERFNVVPGELYKECVNIVTHRFP